MYIFNLLPAFLFTAAAVARESQVPLHATDDLSVPGNNPLKYCADPKDYILDLDSVNLDPNPPKAGQALAIAANGTLSKDVSEDAKVHLQVKYGLIRLINQEVSLCDYVDKVDLKCPLEKGDRNLVKSVDLPNEIPPGKYTVQADVYEPDGSKVTCFEAMVEFKRDGGSFNLW